MDTVFYWTGVVAWAIAAIVGATVLLSVLIDWWLKHATLTAVFLSWYGERLRRRHSAPPHSHGERDQ